MSQLIQRRNEIRGVEREWRERRKLEENEGRRRRERERKGARKSLRVYMLLIC